MNDSLGGPAIVLAVVLAETAVGGVAVLWIAPLWGRVRNGFFKLAGGVFAVFAVLAWLAGRGPLGDCAEACPAQGDLASLMLGVFAAASVGWQVLFWARQRTLARVLGIASVPAGATGLIALALHPGVDAGPAVAVAQVLAGSLFSGAVTAGLLLGHWHLVDRKLGTEPIARINHMFLGGCAAMAVAVIAGGTGGGEARADLSPLLGVGVLTVAIAVGFAALCALIGVMGRKLIREGSLQSATGLFYLGVIMAFAAEFAAKVRFF